MYSNSLRAFAVMVLLIASLGLPGSPVSPLSAGAQSTGCAPGTNPIVCENTQTGNDPIDWEAPNGGDPSIQGFATDISVNKGQPVSFKVTSPATYRIDIFRLGYYGGKGARKVHTIDSLPAQQQACMPTDPATGLIDCANWAVSATWNVPATAVSGIYLARLFRPDTGGANHVPFIVRDDNGDSSMLFQTSDTTWHAYNSYGGKSLYVGSPRAVKVSYNRPFNNRFSGDVGARESFLFTAEYPMVRWLEASGYNVSYTTGADTDRRGGELLKPARKIFLSVGHDEYWSADQRTNVEAARAAGKHLAFFSGNEVFWKTRWENNHRTLVSYKETQANAKVDPSPEWTGTWRDPRFSPPSDGGKPENSLTGTLFMVNGIRNDAITVPAEDGKMRFWRGTSLANQPAGQSITLVPGTLGYEWDEDVDNGHRPAGAMRLSSTTVTVQNQYLLDYGSTFGQGTANHSLMLYRHASGSLVFGAGTTQWSWGLDTVHDTSFGATPQDPVTVAKMNDMRQATKNLFADMGVQPGLPILNPASPSTDTAAPTSTVDPASVPQSLSVMQFVTLPLAGTATDVGGGQVAGVEISTDGGQTWHPANGRGTWSYDWTPTQLGPATIKTRAVDDSGNLQTPGNGITVEVTPRTCTTFCTIWPDTESPNQFGTDTTAFELGVKFRADSDGWITGVRFYKGTANTGNHVASLWTTTGTKLASAPFSNETATGWQTAEFPSAVAITAGTIYVASYTAPNGGYGRDVGYFSNGPWDAAPLHAPQHVQGNPNGMFGNPGQFPNQGADGTNYWVDVKFTTTQPAADQTPPTISGVQADPVTGVSATIKWTTNELADSFVEYGTTPTTLTAGPTDAAFVLNHSVNLIGLNPQTTYYYQVTSKDAAGNTTTSAPVSTFTTGAAPNCPCTIFGDTAPSVFSPDTAAFELGVRFRSDQSGFITGLRFYKGEVNADQHIANLWTNTGTKLATATFPTATATGWQTVNFPTPVQVTAGTTYVASYFAPNGKFADHGGAFFNQGVDNTPLHALKSGVDGPNGIYNSGASGFPQQTAHSNYWVDVVFIGADTQAPVISDVQVGQITTSGATITWTTNEASDTQVAYGVGGLTSSTPLVSTPVLTHTVTLSGLNANTTYQFQAKSRDAAGNLGSSPTLTLTTNVAQAKRSLQFNGTTAYAEAPHATELNVTNDWTVEAWFKDENRYGYWHLPETILIKGDLLRDREIPFGIGIAGGALFVVEKANDHVAYTYYDLHRNRVSANAWHHVAATVKSSTRRVTIYLDGEKVLESTLSRSTSVGNADPVTIGRNGGPTGHANFGGKIDDVRIWNRVRTAQEIKDNYKTQFTTAPGGLVANWKADEGIGTSAADSAGSAQNATLKGGATWSTDVHP